jgi:putative transposase
MLPSYHARWLAILATVLDLYSRKIVGWSRGGRLTSELAQTALQNAIEGWSPKPGLYILIEAKNITLENTRNCSSVTC